jgi:LysM repeat protein
MARAEPDPPDAPACPLLGLVGDPRTHFTFPHPGHRCHAAHRPITVDLARQSSYCLSSGFAACDRFRAHMPPSVKPPSAPLPPPAAPAPSVVHVFRAGDSLARIASAYGVTVEQLVAANNLARANSVKDGHRLKIPLDRPAAGAPTKRRPDRSG